MPDYSIILEHASAAYAWTVQGQFVWANRAYLALADAMGRSPEQLTELVGNASGPLAATGTTWHVSRHGLPAGQLIELLPFVTTPHDGSLDSLTGLLNREAIGTELTRRFANRHERPFALAFTDLDGFKEINDRHGHPAGDHCLEVIGERLRQSLRADDAVGRYGGDEFLILLHGIQGASPLRPIRERLEAAVSQPIEGVGWLARLGLSLGAAFSQGDYSTPQEMLAVADREMYADKRAKPSRPTDIADSSRLG